MYLNRLRPRLIKRMSLIQIPPSPSYADMSKKKKRSDWRKLLQPNLEKNSTLKILAKEWTGLD
jgi:hypothetical protein